MNTHGQAKGIWYFDIITTRNNREKRGEIHIYIKDIEHEQQTMMTTMTTTTSTTNEKKYQNDEITNRNETGKNYDETHP